MYRTQVIYFKIIIVYFLKSIIPEHIQQPLLPPHTEQTNTVEITVLLDSFPSKFYISLEIFNDLPQAGHEYMYHVHVFKKTYGKHLCVSNKKKKALIR